MAKRLEGKVAIVTGASSGIGYAIAKGLAENGAKVLIGSRSQKNISQAEEKLRSLGLNIKGIVCDVSVKQNIIDLVNKCIEEFGQLDIVVSNAAKSTYFGPLLHIDDNEWENYMDTNLKSGFWLAREAVPHLEKTKGNLIYIGSSMAYNPMPLVGMYSITKTAMLALVKVLAKELADKGIRVNGVNPGATETDMAKVSFEAFAGIANSQGASLTGEEMMKKSLEQVVPMKRIGQPEEMSGAVVFLASNEASYITGEIMNVCGGIPTRL